MANQNNYDEDGNLLSSDKGPADLRKANKKLKKENEEMARTLAQYKSESSAQSVQSILEKKGVPGKVAKFIPSDFTTSEQIDEWLTENADVFGYSMDQSDANDEELKEHTAKLSRINRATDSAQSATKDSDIMAKLNDPNLTKADLDALREGSESAGTARRRY